ncbi:MAG TPA: BON domain-containing protein [Chryseosolibacter sp.]|nr:BON domain-containing protein [Chryseosolibacter sp.]
MKYDDEMKSYNRQRWHQPQNSGRQENWGSNYGDHARPYGEDYGDDQAEQSRARERRNQPTRNEHIGFSYGSPGRRSQQFNYERSQVGNHSRGSGMDMETRFDRGTRRGSDFSREDSYMSGEDYDRGSPRYDQNTSLDRIYDQRDFGDRRGRQRDDYNRQGGMGRRQSQDEENFRGYTSEDYSGYREMSRRSEYPETYRSAMSGYMSEHVGHDRGRKDYYQTGQQGNLHGGQYGLYKGKGPRNYKRSDDRIKEQINDRLADDPWVNATEIETDVKNGEVILSGTVNNRSEKRRAEDIVESVSGVSHVENRLRLESTQSSSSQRW